MKTLTIEVTNPEAYRHLIHVMDSAVKPAPSSSHQFAGRLPGVIADELQQHIKRSRDEWNNHL